jgi:16S rRNA processing protein RimM
MKQPYLECGKIINTHGVRGTLKIESYCDSPKILAGLARVFFKTPKGNYTERRVRSASVGKGFVLANLEGIDSLDDAVLYKGKMLYALREDIPLDEGAFFVADLIGLPLIDAENGTVYGEVREVEAMPSSDMYTVLTPSGREVLFPAVKEFVRSVDPEKGIFIQPIAGFFDE